MRKVWLIPFVLVAATGVSQGLAASSASAAKTPPSLFHASSNTSGTTKAFTVTGATWKVGWEYECITRSDFSFQVKGVGASAHTKDKGAGSFGFAESGTSHYKGAGRFKLAVSVAAHCEWSVVVHQST
jgi:hypothetical protein